MKIIRNNKKEQQVQQESTFDLLKQAEIKIAQAIEACTISNKQKKISGKYSLLPHPLKIKKDFKKFNFQKNKKYFILQFNRYMDFNDIAQNNDNIHNSEEGGIPLSFNFLKRSVRKYNTSETSLKIRDLCLKPLHIGNNFDGKGCSSFNAIDKVQKEDSHYGNSKKYTELAYQLLLSGSDEDFNKLNTFYKKNKKTPKKIKKLTKIIKKAKNVEKAKDTKIKTITKTETMVIPSIVLDQMKEARDYVNRLKFRTGKRVKEYLDYFDEIIKNNGIIDLDTHTSFVNGRTFSMFTNMPKLLRNFIFRDFISLDLSNAAYTLLYNVLIEPLTEEEQKDYPLFIGYIAKRDKITEAIADAVILKYYNYPSLVSPIQLDDNFKAIPQKVNRRTDKYNEIKSTVKMSFLAILFGSTLYSYNKEKEQEQVYDVMNSVPEVIALKKEIKRLAQRYNCTVKSLANYFMKRETQFITALDIIIKDDNTDKSYTEKFTLRVHDELIIPDKEYSIKTRDRILNLCKEFNVTLSNINSIRFVEVDEYEDSNSSNSSKEDNSNKKIASFKRRLRDISIVKRFSRFSILKVDKPYFCLKDTYIQNEIYLI